MAKRKSKTNGWVWLVSLVLAVVALFFLYQLGVFTGSQSLSIIPNVLDEGETTLPYTCPNEADYCKVKGIMECNIIQQGESRVLARASDSQYGENGHWVVVDATPEDAFTQLDAWYEDTSTSRSGFANGRNIIRLPFSHWGFISESGVTRDRGLFIFESSQYQGPDMPSIPSSGNIDYLRYRKDAGSGAVTTPTAQHECPGWHSIEACSGFFDAYSCSGDFTVRSSGGNLIYSEDLLYISNEVPGKDETGFITIQSNERAEINGGDYAFLFYQAIEEIQGCLKNVCEGDAGYRQCVNGVPADFIACDTLVGYQCFAGACIPPFQEIGVTLRDDQGNEQDGFTPEENINVFVRIISEFPSLNVNVELREGSVNGAVSQEKTLTLSSGELKKFAFDELDVIGTYFVVLDIDAGLSENIVYGKVASEHNSFRVSNPVSLSMPLPYSPLTGTALYTNSPIYLDLRARDATDNPIEISGYDLDVYFNNVIIPDNGYLVPLPEPGLYRFVYQFSNPGLLRVNARIEKFGIWSNEVSFESETKNPLILTTITNLGVLRIIPLSSQTIKFETRNSFNELIDTANVVKIVPPGASTGFGDIDISSDIVRVGLGSYKVVYNFDEVGGYAINIESSAEGYPIGDSPKSGTITVQRGAIQDECSSTLDCGVGEICSSGKCVQEEQPIWLYILIGVGVVFIIILIIVIVNLSKKKKGEGIDLPGGA